MNKEINRTSFDCAVVEYEVPAKGEKNGYTYKVLEVDTGICGKLNFHLDRNNDRKGIVLDILTK